MTRRVWWWIWGPVVLQMGLIFAASSIPDLTTLPGGITDHAGHFIGYALLGAALIRGMARAQWAGVTWHAGGLAWIAAAAYGASDEGHQWFVPGRSTAVDDWVADALGAGVAIAAVLIVALVRCGAGRAV